MPTVTLAESAKLSQDELVIGIIENVITVNQIFEVFPFTGISGNALAYNRENALGPVAAVGVGDADGSIGSGATGTNQAARQAAKDPATFTQVTSSLTTIMGDAEVNGLIRVTRSNEGNDQVGVQIGSKTKSLARTYQDFMINGDGANFSFPGLIPLCAASQTVDTGANGGALSFAWMDELMDLVVDKDGEVDYFVMHARTRRSFMELLRGLGGASISDTVELPSGREIHAYRGVPVFRNDWIPINQTKGAGSAQTTIFAGTFDDGSMQVGISGLTAEEDAGIQVVDVGESETKDEHIWRVKWYCGLALFSEKGLACADGITN